MKRRLFIGIIAAAQLLSIAGCRQRETPVSMGNRNGILHLGNGSEPKDLDPHIVTGVTEHNVLSALFEGLVAEHPKTLAPVPGTADHWTISPDLSSYRFHLRPDAKWSNGDPVTADDFVFAYRRMLSPRLGAPYAYMLYCIKNAEAYHRGTITDFSQVGVTAPDPQTLVIDLNAPTSYFLSMLSHFAWFPVHRPTILAHGEIDTIGSDWTRPGNLVGNGPFTLTEWIHNKHISVSKSATYWDHQQVSLNGIRFYPIGDHAIEERAFRAGQLHVTGTIPIDRIAHYQKNAPELLHLDPYLGCYYYLFNVRRKPLDDPRVRLALAKAINRQQIVDYVIKGDEAPALHFTPPDTAGYTSRAVITESVEEARKLLAEAGFPDGNGFPRLTLLYNTADAHARIAAVLQQMWKQNLGIEITLVNMEWKVYLQQTQSGQYDIARAGWIADYVDPTTFLDLWMTGGGNNRTGWSNPDYDALVAKAATIADTDDRYAVLQQAEEILMRESPIMPIYFYRSKSLIAPSVQGWHPTILDHHPYKHVRLTPPAEAH